MRYIDNDSDDLASYEPVGVTREAELQLINGLLADLESSGPDTSPDTRPDTSGHFRTLSGWDSGWRPDTGTPPPFRGVPGVRCRRPGVGHMVGHLVVTSRT